MKRASYSFLILSVLFFAVVFPVKAAENIQPKAQIVFVADLSGSMEQADKDQYIKDALKLGIDLAPYDAQIALVTVSDKVILETGLMDTGTEAERTQLKKSINQISYNGNTDFGAGLDKALEILQASGSQGGDRHIIFLGDFVEGGYTTLGSAAAYDKETSALDALTGKAKSQNVGVDLVLIRDAPDESEMAPHILAFPEKTGGQLFRLSDASDFPKAIQDIYFSSFSYLQSSIPVGTVTEGQNIDISMPTDYVNRARIYVAASNPAANVKASYAGAALDGEFGRSYSMIYLNRPARDGVSVTLSPGASGDADIYLLLDYTLRLSVSAANEIILPEGEKEPVQVTTLTAEIQDIQSGQPLLTTNFPDNFQYSVAATGADKEAIELQSIAENPYQFSFHPTSYGSYSVAAELSIGDMKLSVPSETVSIEDIRPVEEPWNWPLIIAISVVCLLILSALIVALRLKKKEAEYQGAAEMSSDYRFHGKLSIYSVMLEGGNRELRPFDFRLHTLSDKRITLRSMLDSVGEKSAYAGAENILFLVGPEESIVVRNNSQAAIRVMGRSYDYRSTTQLFYGQKCYIIFDKDENELEIKYCKVQNEDTVPMQFNIQSRRVHS